MEVVTKKKNVVCYVIWNSIERTELYFKGLEERTKDGPSALYFEQQHNNTTTKVVLFHPILFLCPLFAGM